ncbi:DUF1887 family CARF protein [Sulfurimonas sp.]|jgi:hypothetical protein|uniref:Card1-like endonuclease domain-containing protein n=1 Tax=Sulfurimonas sp. TaxID=2022749 RepID=UPI002A366495|nr:DUF1887 family CARF protein [Sulfurimonas sp.]MDY0123759.1 DUF1887 family CARF protein [Sulfurimonas sp.]
MTLVSIIGDFHSSILPIFHHFKDELENHVVVYDDFRHDVLQAKKIMRGTKHFIEEKNLPITTYTKQIDEDSYDAIKGLAEYILTFAKENKKILINITDGLAGVAYGLAKELKDKDVSFLSYDRFDNTYTLLNDTSMSKPIAVSSMNITDHLTMKNILIESMQDTKNALEYKDEISSLFDEYNGMHARYIKEQSVPAFVRTTPKGFLFELYIYNLLSGLSFDDIALGVKVKDYYVDDDYFTNEFDILIMKNNHLHMIECKFRDDFDQRKTANFIYKLDSIRNTLDDDALMLFLTDDEVYDPEADAIKEDRNAPYKRANARRIFLRGSPIGRTGRFIRDVDSIFSLNTPDIDSLSPQSSIKPTKADELKEELNQFLRTHLLIEIDFFNKKELLRLLNYKINYRNNAKVKESMENEHLKTVIRFLNKMKSESDIHFIYNYFLKYKAEM